MKLALTVNANSANCPGFNPSPTQVGGRLVNQCGIKYRKRPKRPFKETKRTEKTHGSKSKRSAVSEVYLHQAECFYDQKTSVTGL